MLSQFHDLMKFDRHKFSYLEFPHPVLMLSSLVYPRSNYFRRCHDENEKKKKVLKGKHVLVIGGTGGIGSGPSSPLSLTQPSQEDSQH